MELVLKGCMYSPKPLGIDVGQGSIPEYPRVIPEQSQRIVELSQRMPRSDLGSDPEKWRRMMLGDTTIRSSNIYYVQY